jgi:hypothetical protein
MGGKGSGRTGGAKTSPMAKIQAKINRSKRDIKPSPTDAVAIDLRDDPEVERRMSQMGLPPPTTWQEAKTREQVKAEIYRTLAAATELQRMRSTLVPRETVGEAVDLMRDSIQRHVDRIPRAIADAMDVQPAIRAQIVTAGEIAVREALGAAIQEARGK